MNEGVFGGVEVWQGIRDLQYGRRGLVPSGVVTFDDEKGNPCCDPTSQQAHWRRHFTTVLNVATLTPKNWTFCQMIAAFPTNNDVAAALAILAQGLE